MVPCFPAAGSEVEVLLWNSKFLSSLSEAAAPSEVLWPAAESARTYSALVPDRRGAVFAAVAVFGAVVAGSGGMSAGRRIAVVVVAAS